ALAADFSSALGSVVFAPGVRLLIDDQAPRTSLGLREIGVAVGRLGHPQMALPSMEQATTPTALGDLRTFVFRKDPRHLLQHPLCGRRGKVLTDEDHLATRALELWFCRKFSHEGGFRYASPLIVRWWGGGMIDFKGSQFEREIILWGVRWYVAYPISYRQLE